MWALLALGGKLNFEIVAISCGTSTIKEPLEMGADLYISIEDEANYASEHIRYFIWLQRGNHG
jgi:electron transfer flavoprotein alpha/beta subunit